MGYGAFFLRCPRRFLDITARRSLLIARCHGTFPIKLSQLRPTPVAHFLRVDFCSRVADPYPRQRLRLQLGQGMTGSFVPRGKFPKDDYL